MCVLVVYHCITNYSKTLAAKNNKNLLSPIVSVGQESGSGLAWQFRLKISHKIKVKGAPGAAVLSNFPRRGLTSKLTYMAVGKSQVLTGYSRGASIPCYLGLSIVLLATRQLNLPSYERLEKKRERSQDKNHSCYIVQLRSDSPSLLPYYLSSK